VVGDSLSAAYGMRVEQGWVALLQDRLKAKGYGQIPPNYGPLYQRRFERVFAEVAQEQKLPFAAFLLEGLDFGDEHFQADGIHPTAAAQPVLLRNAWPPLARALSDTGLCGADPRWALQRDAGAGAGG